MCLMVNLALILFFLELNNLILKLNGISCYFEILKVLILIEGILFAVKFVTTCKEEDILEIVGDILKHVFDPSC